MEKSLDKLQQQKRMQMKHGYANQQAAAAESKVNDCRSLADFEQLAYERPGDKPIRCAADKGYDYIDKNDRDSRKSLE